MDTLRKTITVTKQQIEWINARIESGDFTDFSEYMRYLIRRDQARSLQIESIRDELIKGELSSEPVVFDSDHFKTKMAACHAQ